MTRVFLALERIVLQQKELVNHLFFESYVVNNLN